LSMPRPQRPLICWDKFGRASVMPGWRERPGGNDRRRRRCGEATSARPSGTRLRGRSPRPGHPAATAAGGRKASPRRPRGPGRQPRPAPARWTRRTRRRLGHGPAGSDDGVNDRVAEPAGGPGPARDLGGGFEEREPGAVRFLAVPAVLGPEDLHGAGDGMSGIRWKRRSFRLVAMTPQVGQPVGCSDSTMTRRPPSSSTAAEMTR
jgi:hypothetical protein